MTTTDVLIISATLLGPIFAVQAQKWIERYQESRNRKLSLFSALMSTRATPLSPDHVRALNTIDITFINDKKVIAKWREYHDSLNQINQQTGERFIDLLYAMSEALNFKFDKVMLKRVSYLPQAHVDAENSQIAIRESLQKMLAGQTAIQSNLLECLTGNKAIKVSIEKNHTP